eukprot:2753850-Rhodomonas_salina.1
MEHSVTGLSLRSGAAMAGCLAPGLIVLEGAEGSGFAGTYSVDAASGSIQTTLLLAHGAGYRSRPALRLSDPHCRCGTAIEH